MQKKVIFVAGTSFSGSTMLDMTLANDPKGYSLGEIHALMRPYRKHHFKERERLKTDKIWGKIINDGEKKLYKNLFNLMPEYDYFVDSSKNPNWIKNHINNLNEMGVENHCVLIYKSPDEIFASFKKRNRTKQWEKSYINYHRLFFSLINNFIPISYRSFATNEESNKRLFELLNLTYSPNKREFWQKEHKTFFGNNRTRIHSNLTRLGNDGNIDLIGNNEKIKSINYTTSEVMVDTSSITKNIYQFLNSKELITINKPKSLKFSFPILTLYNLKYQLQNFLTRLQICLK